MDHYVKTSHIMECHLTIPDPSRSYPTISDEEYARPGPFLLLPHIITSPSPCYSQASRPRATLQNLRIDFFIIELINPPAHHNSGDASTNPLRHRGSEVPRGHVTESRV